MGESRQDSGRVTTSAGGILDAKAARFIRRRPDACPKTPSHSYHIRFLTVNSAPCHSAEFLSSWQRNRSTLNVALGSSHATQIRTESQLVRSFALSWRGCTSPVDLHGCCRIVSIGELESAPISSLLIVLVMPAVCFALGVVLLDTNSYSRFSLFTKFAMGTAVLPVILGTLSSVWTVRELFGVSFQNASIRLKCFAALAVFTLVAIAGELTRRCIVNCLPCQEGKGLSS